jgi:serine/threonine protein kinase SCH9
MAHEKLAFFHALLCTDLLQSSARHELREDMQDHIGTESPTPSGVETPRPDFHDKRLPGIMHSYFGQVGSEPSTSSPLRRTQTPAVDLDTQKHQRRRASTSSMGSMVMVERDQNQLATPPPDEPPDDTRKPDPDPSRMPPTPISSASSVVQRDGDSAENGKPLADSGLASITQALRNFVLPKSSFSGHARRHQSLPVSSVTMKTVPATHISNPSSTAQSSKHQSPSDSPSHKPTQTQSITEDTRLTEGVVEKATPPHTPRALSQEDRQRSPLAEEKKEPETKLPTQSPRGKLTVKIAEGRNIKPAFDPYVVVTFEYNEYISRGSKHDQMDVDTEVPMRRTDSESGRAMAIPMRSRQSSTNGMNDESGRPLNRVTDPNWDHEALL